MAVHATLCLLSLVTTSVIASSGDSSDLFHRTEVLDEKLCSKPYPSEHLIDQLRHCDPMVRIVVRLSFFVTCCLDDRDIT